MSRVVTLPITPLQYPSFLTLFTPFFADVLAKATGANLGIMVNTVGMKSYADSETVLKDYNASLEGIGIKNHSSFHDGHASYDHCFHTTLDTLLDAEMINVSKKTIKWCECGRVEIPEDVLINLITEQRKKSLIRGDSLQSVTCSKCGSGLQTAAEDVLSIQIPAAQPDELYPQIYQSELLKISERQSQNSVIISRRHRTTPASLSFEGVSFGIDTDFRWIGYLDFVFGSQEDITIVSSPTTLNQAMKVIAFGKMLNPFRTIRLVVHPLIRMNKSNASISRMSIQEFLGEYTPIQARMFLATGIGWNTYESTVLSESMFLVLKTLEQWYGMGPVVMERMQHIPQIFHKENILNAYKAIRAQRQLDREFQVIMHGISP